MMVQLKCLGARPKGKHPVIVEEWGNKLAIKGQLYDGKDMTYAQMICQKYPGCFEIVVPLKESPKEQAKTLQNAKDKMLPKASEKASEKEFS